MVTFLLQISKVHMNLENIIEDWMGFVLVFVRKPVSWLSLLAPPFLRFLGAGFLQILLTSAALLLSSFFFTTPTEGDKAVASSAQEEKDEEEEEDGEEDRQSRKKPLMMKRSPVTFLDESEFSQEQSCITEDCDISDGTISDEESLIELSLPSGHYVGHYNYDGHHDNKQQDIKHCNKKQLYLHKGIKDFTLMELLAEFDTMEEDNLIEIDISMGSIKCSRFEMKS